MKKYLVILFSLLAATTARSAAIGEWTAYLSYCYATRSIAAGTTVYALYDGNLLAYDTRTTEVRLFSRTDGLSGRYINRVAYSDRHRCLVIAYADGNIDLLADDGSIWNLPQLKNANDGSMDICDLSVCDDRAVISTGRGVACVDLKKKVLENYYTVWPTVYSAAIFDGRLFVATPDAIVGCPLGDNAFDRRNWTILKELRAKRLLPMAESLMAVVPWVSGVSEYNCGIWGFGKSDEQGRREEKRINTAAYRDAVGGNGKAFFMHASHLAVVDESDWRNVEHYWDVTENYTDISYSPDGTCWVADGYNGLRPCRITDTGLQPSDGAVGGYGPRRDYCYYMKYVSDRLFVAGGRIADVFYDGVAYVLEGGEWKNFQDEGISTITGVRYVNASSIAQDISDPSHHYVASGGTGLYEFRDFAFVRNYTLGNSPLVAANGAIGNPLYVRVDGLNMDAQRNLWMVNNERDTVLYALKPDGTWKGIYIPELRNAPTCEKTLIDRRGRLWVASRRTVSNHTAGLLCLDYNGTVDNTNDDVAVYRTSAPNQDGIACKLNGVYSLAEDTDGSIWVGTSDALFVVSDPDAWGDADFRLTQIKVPRNDGTNYADYLMAGLPVTAIAIDGAGRKWMGTATSGVYAVSPDGTEVLHHFDTSNSPILSDNVYSIACHPATGEIMIGTDQGLCSYTSEASAPAASLDKSSVLVYPNPVRPDYHGDIIVRGLTDAADVKVVTTGGQVVAGGTSVGGTYVWDGRMSDGARVASGVYAIMVATADGKSGIVAKVVVI